MLRILLDVVVDHLHHNVIFEAEVMIIEIIPPKSFTDLEYVRDHQPQTNVGTGVEIGVREVCASTYTGDVHKSGSGITNDQDREALILWEDATYKLMKNLSTGDLTYVLGDLELITELLQDGRYTNKDVQLPVDSIGPLGFIVFANVLYMGHIFISINQNNATLIIRVYKAMYKICLIIGRLTILEV